MDPSSEDGVRAAIDIIDNEIRAYRIKGKYGNMFPQRWIPTSIGILSEGFTIENKLMNPTYKIIRPKVNEHYSDLFEFLYKPQSKDISNDRNMESMKRLLE